MPRGATRRCAKGSAVASDCLNRGQKRRLPRSFIDRTRVSIQDVLGSDHQRMRAPVRPRPNLSKRHSSRGLHDRRARRSRHSSLIGDLSARSLRIALIPTGAHRGFPQRLVEGVLERMRQPLLVRHNDLRVRSGPAP